MVHCVRLSVATPPAVHTNNNDDPTTRLRPSWPTLFKCVCVCVRERDREEERVRESEIRFSIFFFFLGRHFYFILDTFRRPTIWMGRQSEMGFTRVLTVANRTEGAQGCLRKGG